jgi:hypothetical protein
VYAISYKFRRVSVARIAQTVQNVSVPLAGEIELAGVGGFNAGAVASRVSSAAFGAGLAPVDFITPTSNGTVGGQIAISIRTRLLVTEEFSYVAGGRVIFNEDFTLNQLPLTSQQISVNGHSSALLATAGIRYRIPLERAQRFLPYAGVSVGGLRNHVALSQSIIGESPGETFSGSAATFHPLGEFSAGVRYYFSEKVGILTEGGAFRGPDVPLFGRVDSECKSQNRAANSRLCGDSAAQLLR